MKNTHSIHMFWRAVRVILVLSASASVISFKRASAEYIGPANRVVEIPGDDFTVITGRLFRWATATYICDYEVRTDTNKVHAGFCTQGQWNDQPTCQAYRDCVDSGNPNCNSQPYPTCTGYYRRSPFGSYVVTKSQTVQLPNATVSALFQCPSSGNGGWCLSIGTVEILGVEPVPEYTILAIEGSLDGTPFACGGSMCSVPIPDGHHSIEFWTLSSWGDSSLMDSLEPKVDTQLPSVDGSANGTMGSGEWFVSPVQLSVTGDDSLSGLATAAVRVNGTSWQTNSTSISSDGVHAVEFRTSDLAGNQNILQSTSIKIDQSPPQLRVTNPGTNTPTRVTESLAINGTCIDAISGVQRVEVSQDNQQSWQRLNISANGDWTYTWDLHSAPNGQHRLDLRCKDAAGNNSTPASVQAIVDGRCPDVEIPSQWYIWESPEIRITEGNSPVQDVQITIHDPKERWPDRVNNYTAGNIPGNFTWDRRFGDGILAPPGSYFVSVTVRDKFGNQGTADGNVIIPQPSIQASPSPTSTSDTTPSRPQSTLTPTSPPLLVWTPTGFVLDDVITPIFEEPTPRNVSLHFRSTPVSQDLTMAVDEEATNIDSLGTVDVSKSSPLWGLAALGLASAATAVSASRRRAKKKTTSKGQQNQQTGTSDQVVGLAAGNGGTDLHSSDHPPYIAEPIWNRLPITDRDYITRQLEAWTQNGLPVQGISIGDTRYVHIDLTELNSYYSYASDENGLLLNDEDMPVIIQSDISSLGLDPNLLQGETWVEYDIEAITRDLNIYTAEGQNWRDALQAVYAGESEASLAVRLLLSEIGADRLLTNANNVWESQAILHSVFERIEALGIDKSALTDYGFEQISRPLFGDHVAQLLNVITSPGQYLGMYTSRAYRPLTLYTGGESPLLSEEEYLTAVDLAFTSYALANPELNPLDLAIPDFTGTGNPMIDMDGNDINALQTLGATRYVHRCGYDGALTDTYGQAFAQTYGLTTPHCDINNSCYTAGTNPATGPLVLSEFLRFDENFGYYLYRESLQIDYVPHSLIESVRINTPALGQSAETSPPKIVGTPHPIRNFPLSNDDLLGRIE